VSSNGRSTSTMKDQEKMKKQLEAMEKELAVTEQEKKAAELEKSALTSQMKNIVDQIEMSANAIYVMDRQNSPQRAKRFVKHSSYFDGQIKTRTGGH
jgi:uncharacterized protein (DUF3084 family)